MSPWFEYSLAATCISMFVLIFVLKAGSIAVSAWVAAFAAGISLTTAIVARITGFAKGESIEWGLVGLAAVEVLVSTYCFWRLRDASLPIEAQIQKLSKRLSKYDVLVPMAGYAQPGICWHCGHEPAPLCSSVFSEVLVVGAVVAGTEVSTAVPICSDHQGRLNMGPHWVRMLCVPAAIAVFFIGLGALMRDGAPAWQARLILCALFATAFTVFFIMRRWANRMETFRLVWTDPLKGMMIARFNCEERALRIREEAQKPGKLLWPEQICSNGLDFSRLAVEKKSVHRVSE